MKFQSWLFIFGLGLNLFFIYTFTNYDMAAIGFVTAVDNPMTHEVTITAKGFSPSSLTIRQGDTVRWTSKSERVSVIFSNNPHQRFTSNEIEQGETYSHLYDTAGDFAYVDVNFGYKGIVNVLPNSKTEQLSETETEQPAQIKNENIPLPASCPSCTQGCSLNTETCSCSCPCQRDSDCDDSKSYTKDYCNKNPVECRNEQMGAQPAQNVTSDYKNQIVIMAILFALGIFLYITKVFIMNPKNATTQQKNIQQNSVVQKTRKSRK